MNEQEQRRRQRAYQIWEDEGRPEGQHLDHWARAEDQHEATEEQAAEVTEANRTAKKQFNDGDTTKESAMDIRPPSMTSAD
ncbi:DUF2934 domain-containing protein [Rhizobium grahamii]|uniref:DUF2934 domain-containing protein n=1 Tax=Rhizobium grahamii TaxID=1120045 RepID=A0A370KGD8_9HYPH|nr:DUF2934 domain-containing protein [Rhizobium grahamii]RDJ03843.1 hypothetical protein B5K06_28395 [Rhizobium grahamii]